MARILVSEKVHPCGLALLQQAGHEVIYLEHREKREMAEKLKDADGLFVRVMDITPEMLEDAPRLKIISKHGVGVDNIPMETAKQRGIAVTITPGANSQAVAEHAFALLMALAKNLAPVSNAYRKIGFEAKNYREGTELEGKTLGVIGCGRIGSRVAKMGRGGFDMEVLGYDPYLKTVPQGCQKVDELTELVRRSDFVTLHAPLTQETHHMIGKELLAVMKPTAYLINCARGPMVDEEALIQALKGGCLAGAGLDVTEEEPADPENPLFNMENVILTPHYAPATLDTAMRVSTIGCQNLVDFFAGREPAGRVL